MRRCFVAHRLHLLYHVFQICLSRIVGDGGLFGGKVDAGVFHSRNFFESLFDAHGAGGAGHPLQFKYGATLRTWLNSGATVFSSIE